MSKFWEAMGGKLADRWASAAAGSLLFWAGVALVVFHVRRDSGGLAKLVDSVARQPVVSQVMVVLAALVVVGGSALAVRRLLPFMLSQLQGPWRGYGISRLSSWFTKVIEHRVQQWEKEWQALAVTMSDAPTLGQRGRYVRLDERLRQVPPAAAGFLPTPIGNVVRAADCRIEAKYGLVVSAVWSRLWLVLPQPVRDELTQARSAVDSAVAAVVWGLAFAVLGFWAWWAAPAGLLVVAGALWLWLPSRVAAFADLTEAAFDLHRFTIYEQLRLPPPDGPDGEPATGAALSQFLYRGTAPAGIKYTEPAKETTR